MMKKPGSRKSLLPGVKTSTRAPVRKVPHLRDTDRPHGRAHPHHHPPRRSPLVITPGSVVMIHTGALKGKEKIVSRVRQDRYFLRDATTTSFGKKAYQINVAASNCRLVLKKSKSVKK